MYKYIAGHITKHCMSKIGSVTPDDCFTHETLCRVKSVSLAYTKLTRSKTCLSTIFNQLP